MTFQEGQPKPAPNNILKKVAAVGGVTALLLSGGCGVVNAFENVQNARRMNTLEAQMNTDRQGNAGSVGDLRSDVDGLKSDVNGLHTDVENLQQSQAGINKQLAAQKKDIRTILSKGWKS